MKGIVLMKGTFSLKLYRKQLSLSSFREQPVSAPLFADHGSESAPRGSFSHRSRSKVLLALTNTPCHMSWRKEQVFLQLKEEKKSANVQRGANNSLKKSFFQRRGHKHQSPPQECPSPVAPNNIQKWNVWWSKDVGEVVINQRCHCFWTNVIKVQIGMWFSLNRMVRSPITSVVSGHRALVAGNWCFRLSFSFC